MLKQKGLALLGAAAALAAGIGSANAAVSIVSVQNISPMGYSFTPSTLITFNNFAPGTPANFTTGGVTFVSDPVATGASIEQGTSPGGAAYKAPFHDNTPYLALGSASSQTGTNSETLTIASGATSAGFYWGSIDGYNSVQFLMNGVSEGTFTGNSLSSFGISPGSNQSAYVSFSGSPFNEIILSTTQPNFELDNVALVTGVPEPSTWAMMLLGFGGLGALLYRRSKTSASNGMAMQAYA